MYMESRASRILGSEMEIRGSVRKTSGRHERLVVLLLVVDHPILANHIAAVELVVRVLALEDVHLAQKEPASRSSNKSAAAGACESSSELALFTALGLPDCFARQSFITCPVFRHQ